MNAKRRARRRLQRREEYVLTGLEPHPNGQAVANIGPYDRMPPAVRQWVANHDRPIIFVRTPTGQIAMAVIQ